MNKVFFLLIIFPITVSANTESIKAYCNNLKNLDQSQCEINFKFIWKNITKGAAAYCFNFREKEANMCLTIAGCSDYEPQSVMDCLINLNNGIEKLCSLNAIRVYSEAVQTCTKRQLELTQDILDQWESEIN